MNSDFHASDTLELRSIWCRLRPHRSAEGHRPARCCRDRRVIWQCTVSARSRHREANRRMSWTWGRSISPASSNAWARRRWSRTRCMHAHGQELLRQHRARHHRDGDQRSHHRGRHAAGGASLLGRRRLRTGSPMRSARRHWSPDGSALAMPASVAWGGGETPALAGIVHEAAASTWPHRVPGLINPKERLSVGDQAWRRAMRSCCSHPAASTPTASVWRAS